MPGENKGADSHECQDLGPVNCWVEILNCDNSKYCYDIPGLADPECVECYKDSHCALGGCENYHCACACNIDEDCPAAQKCDGCTCIDKQCGDFPNTYGDEECGNVNNTTCFPGDDVLGADAYECQDLGPVDCWVILEDCPQSEYCYDPASPWQGAMCVECHENAHCDVDEACSGYECMPSGGTVISGEILYEDWRYGSSGDLQDHPNPARFAAVRVVDSETDEVIVETNTNSDGSYSVLVEAPIDANTAVQILSDTEAGVVASDLGFIWNSTYIYTDTSYVATAEGADFGLEIVPHIAGAGAFNALDMIIEGYTYSDQAWGLNVGQVELLWSHTVSNTAYCSIAYYWPACDPPCTEGYACVDGACAAEVDQCAPLCGSGYACVEGGVCMEKEYGIGSGCGEDYVFEWENIHLMKGGFPGDAYGDLHPVLHEYGHFIHDQLDWAGLLGGSHAACEAVSDVSPSHPLPRTVAWFEGLASVLALHAFAESSSGAISGPYLGPDYEAGNKELGVLTDPSEEGNLWSVSFEEPSDSVSYSIQCMFPTLGCEDEIAVGGLLWDILDPANEPYDDISGGGGDFQAAVQDTMASEAYIIKPLWELGFIDYSDVCSFAEIWMAENADEPFKKLMSEFKLVGCCGVNVIADCGNGVVEEPEDCELDDDCLWPGNVCEECACVDGGTECGNDIVEPGEDCEIEDDCPAEHMCTSCECVPVPMNCGDGKVDQGEQCDEPNMDACEPYQDCIGCKCVGEPPLDCGNGELDAGEECDPPFVGQCEDWEDCLVCQCVGEPPPDCGDGNLDGGEECDPPVMGQCEDWEDCENCECVGEPPPVVCGDGVLEQEEDCEQDADCPPSQACAQCECKPIPPKCGDGKVDPGEECDPPNVDACAWYQECVACSCGGEFPVCGNGSVDPGEECEENEHCAADHVCAQCECLPVQTKCGDGKLDPGEECDLPHDEACESYQQCLVCTCVGEPPPECGNGEVDAGEECENNDHCKADHVCDQCECIFVPPACGDTVCSPSENCQTCPEDCECPPGCPDDACEGAETCKTCPADCGFCCGNETCQPEFGENCSICAVDCGFCCGNGKCELVYGENHETCPADCEASPTCPDADCGTDENCNTCPGDCGQCCGDETCQPQFGEDCDTCLADCGFCCGNGKCELVYGESHETCPADCEVPPTCPDGECGANENCSNCPGDCGQCCGNEACQPEFGENCNTCSADCGFCCGNGNCDIEYGEGPGTCAVDCTVPPACPDNQCNADENCNSCPEDCGDCCGNGICQPQFGEDCDLCPADCGDCCGNGSCEVGYGENHLACPADCEPPPDCPDGTCGTGENCINCPEDCGECCANGTCQPQFGEDCNGCPNDCGECCGNGNCEGAYGENYQTCPADCKPPPDCPDGACGAGETCNNCPDDCGLCCGNGTCQPQFGEDCEHCPADCGDCCGNGSCEGAYGENQETCPADCKPSAAICPDGACDAGETCNSCPDDCGLCCGNGSCDYDEACETCPQDCVEDCEPLCGDGNCADGETCETCPSDCGACSCVPECAEKQCGPDGCEGSCGECNTGEMCSEGKCLPDDDLELGGGGVGCGVSSPGRARPFGLLMILLLILAYLARRTRWPTSLR